MKNDSPIQTQTHGKHSTLRGVVKSTASQNTLVVEVTTYKTHEKYLKKYKSSKHYHVHDESGTHKVGDQVEFIPTRPISKLKRFIIVPKDNA